MYPLNDSTMLLCFVTGKKSCGMAGTDSRGKMCNYFMCCISSSSMCVVLLLCVCVVLLCVCVVLLCVCCTTAVCVVLLCVCCTAAVCGSAMQGTRYNVNVWLLSSIPIVLSRWIKLYVLLKRQVVTCLLCCYIGIQFFLCYAAVTHYFLGVNMQTDRKPFKYISCVHL